MSCYMLACTSAQAVWDSYQMPHPAALLQVSSADRAGKDCQSHVSRCQSRHAVLLPLLQPAFFSSCAADCIFDPVIFPDQVCNINQLLHCMKHHLHSCFLQQPCLHLQCKGCVLFLDLMHLDDLASVAPSWQHEARLDGFCAHFM